MHEALIRALTETLGPGAVHIGGAIPTRHHTDWSGIAPVRPRAVLCPASTAQVAAAMRLCHAHRVPVVPQGGLTGLVGGAVPNASSIVISLERMNAIGPVDVLSGTLVAQAGATLQSIQEAAAGTGHVFGVDLGARGSCQVGGNVATNAGGNGVVQFGMMREQLLGLEVVLPDGTVLDMLRPMLKNNTGYDLKHWFVGSEGTLGIITRAMLRLHPEPRAKITLLAALPDYTSAVALLRRLKAEFPGGLAAFELMWEDFFSASLVWSATPTPFAQIHPFAAIAEVVGHDEEALLQCLHQALAFMMEEGQVLDAVIAQSRAKAAALWRIREATSELAARMKSINFDISLPIDRIGDFADRCVELLMARWPDQHSVRFGHLGDGNLHLSIDARSLGDLEFEEAERQVEEIVYGLLAEEGGSVSAEHGIGLHKKAYLCVSRSPVELGLMRAIKQAIDPLNLLNPGKVFDLR